MKRPDKPDVVEVITGDYNVKNLYGYMLTPDNIEQEIEQKTYNYMKLVKYAAQRNNWKSVQYLISLPGQEEPDYHSIYLQIAQVF